MKLLQQFPCVGNCTVDCPDCNGTGVKWIDAEVPAEVMSMIPDWAGWVAQDSDGIWCVFDGQPYTIHGFWQWATGTSLYVMYSEIVDTPVIGPWDTHCYKIVR